MNLLSSRSRSSRRTYNAAAVVTGAGSGIGRSFARNLAQRGSRVVCADIDAAKARETAEAIADSGGRSLAVACDVSDFTQVEVLAETSEQWFGNPATLIINNAGIGTGGTPIGETPLQDWHHTLDVNLWGVIHGCQVFVPRLREHGRGGIINVASAASFAAGPRMAAYNVSKAGVLALSETLAAELSGTGIAVTVLCPTLVKTNIASTDAIDPGAAELASTLMKWVGMSPDTVARTTLDGHDRRQLHVLPQIDAKLVWRAKRLMPGPYTRVLGIVERVVR
ncbi:SDR family NAD(P)-dependent oxidoreductase [Nocardia sp. NPDC051756]|uniref:SDR family NAD(P)-dependent oxidoreductase n=1 Tax=Nocardia sp. NPDC051756 TaxID=3154751 RepID=UPI0034228072